MTDMAESRRFAWVNKIIRIFLSFFIAIGAVLNIAPFSIVHAEYLAYSTSENGVPYFFSGNIDNTFAYSDSNNGTVNCVVLKPVTQRTDRYVLVFFGDTNFSVKYGKYNINGNYYYNYATYNSSYNSTHRKYVYLQKYVIYSNDLVSGFQQPVNILDGLESMTNDQILDYIFNNLPPDIDYGEIQDLAYSTNIVGSGGSTTGDSNIDEISWYPFWDTNSNISVGWNMQVQVVPVSYIADTQENLFLMSINDLIINYSGAVDIYNGEYSKGSISVSWGNIKQKLSILQWSDLFSYFDGAYWNKKGWIYRARFTDNENNYTSAWQVIYSVTSSNGEGVEKYVDPSDGTGLPGFYQDVENSFNTTSVINNNTNVTHIYTGVPMTVNIDDTETSDDITQIKKYVKQIRDILISLNTENSTTENNENDQEITNNLNGVVGDLHTTEEEFMTDMDEKLNNIDRNVELLNDNKFIAAANWVRIQYDNIVSDTPFELLIVFGLVLSLALIIIGKIR